MTAVIDILNKSELTKADIIRLLSIVDGNEQELLIKKAYSIKEKNVGKKVYLRGLIEFSNRCQKNCLYCGIRNGNEKVSRYSLTDLEILKVIEFAINHQFTGIVLQGGEQNNRDFTKRISELITKIKATSNPEFRITLSMGEQSFDTYKKWFDAGAQRYLLRIETSNEELFKRIHSDNQMHRFNTRFHCLEDIQKIGYQTGTGVMIGLPFQTIEHLADDLLFIKKMNIDMVGMGPYLEHADTPLFKYKELLLPLMDRLNLSIRMIAVLRLLMPYINIASTTALQSIHPFGRELGLKAGANVIMPNLTPAKYRGNYLLYDNKPCIYEEAVESIDSLSKRIIDVGEDIVYDDYGDSIHFKNRVK